MPTGRPSGAKGSALQDNLARVRIVVVMLFQRLVVGLRHLLDWQQGFGLVPPFTFTSLRTQDLGISW